MAKSRAKPKSTTINPYSNKEAKPLLDAINDNPADSLGSSIFKDWLLDHEDEDRAEFIELQIEMGRSHDSNDISTLIKRLRAFQLFKAHKKEWFDAELQHIPDLDGLVHNAISTYQLDLASVDEALGPDSTQLAFLLATFNNGFSLLHGCKSAGQAERLLRMNGLIYACTGVKEAVEAIEHHLEPIRLEFPVVENGRRYRQVQDPDTPADEEWREELDEQFNLRPFLPFEYRYTDWILFDLADRDLDGFARLPVTAHERQLIGNNHNPDNILVDLGRYGSPLVKEAIKRAVSAEGAKQSVAILQSMAAQDPGYFAGNFECLRLLVDKVVDPDLKEHMYTLGRAMVALGAPTSSMEIEPDMTPVQRQFIRNMGRVSRGEPEVHQQEREDPEAPWLNEEEREVARDAAAEDAFEQYLKKIEKRKKPSKRQPGDRPSQGESHSK